MRDFFDAKGVSGAAYRFDRLRQGFPLSAMGGNVIFAREQGEQGEGVEIVYAFATDCISRDAHKRWDEAVEAYGTLHLFTRLNFSRHTRQHEHNDIVAAASPPMSDAAPDAGSPPPPAADVSPPSP